MFSNQAYPFEIERETRLDNATISKSNQHLEGSKVNQNFAYKPQQELHPNFSIENEINYQNFFNSTGQGNNFEEISSIQRLKKSSGPYKNYYDYYPNENFNLSINDKIEQPSRKRKSGNNYQSSNQYNYPLVNSSKNYGTIRNQVSEFYKSDNSTNLHSKRRQRQSNKKNSDIEDILNFEGQMSPKDIITFSYSLSKDQRGCRYLQEKIEEDPEFANLYLFPAVTD